MIEYDGKEGGGEEMMEEEKEFVRNGVVWNGFCDFIYGNDLFHSVVAVGFWPVGKEDVSSTLLVKEGCKLVIQSIIQSWQWLEGYSLLFQLSRVGKSAVYSITIRGKRNLAH